MIIKRLPLRRHWQGTAYVPLCVYWSTVDTAHANAGVRLHEFSNYCRALFLQRITCSGLNARFVFYWTDKQSLTLTLGYTLPQVAGSLDPFAYDYQLRESGYEVCPKSR